MVKFPDYDGTQLCVGLPMDFFYNEPEHMSLSSTARKDLREVRRQVKALCYQCKFQTDCLEWALHHERYGLWGGTLEDERSTIRKNRGITVVDPLHML